MVIRFISIIEDSGIELASYPKHHDTDIFGGIITAVSEAVQRLGYKDLKKISVGEQAIYVNPINEKILLVVSIGVDDSRSNYVESIQWLIDLLRKKIKENIENFEDSELLFSADYQSTLEPALKEAIIYHESVEERLKKLSKLFKNAKKLIGAETDELIKRCERGGVLFKNINEDLYISETDLDFIELKDHLERCISLLKSILSDLL